AAFLLLSDSRSSFQIEGEAPSTIRISRWGRAIGEAGTRSLAAHELEALQRIVIGDSRLVRRGLRTEDSFVGMHDRTTGEPLPDHVNARPKDLPGLLDGLRAYEERALAGGLDPVVATAATSFG